MNTPEITAKYIKCHADRVGCRSFELEHPKLKGSILVLALNRADAMAELEDQIGALLSKHPNLRKKGNMSVCHHCNGEGEVEI